MKNPRRVEPMAGFGRYTAKQLRQQNIQMFRNRVRFLVRLWKGGALDDNEFDELVKRAVAVSIEAEIADRVERGLKLKIERVLRHKVKKVLEDKIRTDYLPSLPKLTTMD